MACYSHHPPTAVKLHKLKGARSGPRTIFVSFIIPLIPLIIHNSFFEIKLVMTKIDVLLIHKNTYIIISVPTHLQTFAHDSLPEIGDLN